MCPFYDKRAPNVQDLAAEGVAEPWRYAGGIRDLTPEERELWRVYCLAKRCRVDLPLWVVPVFGWFAELEDGMDRARARAEREALSDAR